MPTNKKWYEDWKLSVSSSVIALDSGIVGVYLPHSDIQQVLITGRLSEIKQLANLLDKLLCELTGTKTTEIIDSHGRYTESHT